MRKILFATITFLGLINVSCISNDWEDNSVSSEVIEQPISGKFLNHFLEIYFHLQVFTSRNPLNCMGYYMD